MGYSYTLPPASDRDIVRFLIQDTDEETHRVEDEEIDIALAENANRYFAAALVCDALSVRFISRGNITVGRLSIQNTQIGQDYASRGTTLRRLADMAGMTGPEMLGSSLSEIDRVNQDTDRAPDHFHIGMHDVHSPAAYQG